VKVTVISDARGKVVGAIQGHTAQPDTTEKPGRARKEPRSGLYAGPGQRLREIELGDEFAKTKDAAEFHTKLEKHLKKHPL
jgi:hypothetical protein